MMKGGLHKLLQSLNLIFLEIHREEMNNPQGFVFGLKKFRGFEIFEGHYFSLLFQLVFKTRFRNFGNLFMIMKICLNACTIKGAR